MKSSNMQSKKAYLYTFTHCKRRDIDAARIANYLKKNGYQLTKKIRKADLIVCNTCAHIKQLEEASLRKIKLLNDKKKKQAQLVVCGCLPQINKPRLDSVFQGVSFGPRSLEKFDQLIQPKVPMHKIDVPSVFDLSQYNTESLSDKLYLRSEPSFSFFAKCLEYLFQPVARILGMRYHPVEGQFDQTSPFDQDVFWIKIAEGCLSSCTYCSSRFATGKLKSRPLQEVIRKFRKGLSKGYEKFFLVGADCGAYGQDFGSSLYDLLVEIFKWEGNYKISILDMHPKWLVADFFRLKNLIKKKQRKIDCIMLPVQSGSQKVLELMQREYSIKELGRKLADFKRDIPDVKVFTEAIVGFPGETKKDFQDTLGFIETVKFDGVLFFKYSDRPQVLAASFPQKIPATAKDIRLLRAWVFYKKRLIKNGKK